MAKKKTSIELLQDIAELLTPVSNLSKYSITQINQQLAAQEAELAKKDIQDDKK